uniref:Myosin phosphatase Rho interacting protein n=1 Tax=Naja naja TaxID=35670 RepID=A0A8C6XV97_NAJNA
MAAKENPCRKFQANIFNKSKCQNCFKPRESHLLNDEDLNQAKPIYGGWLLLAPEGTDFDNPVHRSRKWQRRFFILYEHGLLRYALDEMPTTLPQGTINMNQCMDVVDGENRTGQKFSLCILTPEKEHFIRAENKEIISGWLEMLVVYPRTNKQNQKKKRKVEPPTPQEPGPAKMAVTSSSIPGAEKIPTTKSTLWQEELRSKDQLDGNLHLSSLPCFPHPPDEAAMNGDRNDCGRKTRVESGYFSLEKTKQEVKAEEHQMPNLPSPPSPCTPNHRYSDLKSQQPSDSFPSSGTWPAGRMVTEERRNGPMAFKVSRKYSTLADVPKAIRISNRDAFQVERKRLEWSSRARSPGREEVARLFGNERRRSQVIEKFEALDIENPEHMEINASSGLSSETRQGRSEKRVFPRKRVTSGAIVDVSTSTMSPHRRAKSLDRRSTESSMTPDLLNFKKGWLTKQDEDGQWKKHWFVLTDQSLRYYRDSVAEEAADLDGEIDLSTCFDVTEYSVQRNYGFQIHTKEGKFILSAMTSGIRRNWIQTIMKHVRPTVAPDVTSSLPEEKSKNGTSFETCPKPSEKQETEQAEIDPEYKRSRARERRREGRSKTFDWAEFRPIQQVLAQERASLAETLKDTSAPFPKEPGPSETDPGELERERARRREERRKRFEHLDATDGGSPEDFSRMEVDRLSGLPAATEAKSQSVHVEIEQRWHQVETTPLREEKQIPIAPLHLPQPEENGEILHKQHLTVLLEKELEQSQKAASELLEQNRVLQDQLKVALGREQSAREGYVLQVGGRRRPGALPQRLHKVNKDLQGELEAQCQRQEMINQQIQSLKRSYGEAKDVIRHHEAEIQSLQARLSNAAADLSIKEQTLAKLKSDLKAEKKKTEEQMEEWQHSETTLNSQLKASEQKLKKAEALLLQKTQELRDLEMQQALQRDYQKEVQRLQDRIADLSLQLSAGEQSRMLMEKKLQKNYESLLESCEREKQILIQSLKEAEDKASEYESQLQNNEQQKEILLKEKLSAKFESSELVHQLEDHLEMKEASIRKLVEHIKSLEEERDQIKCRFQELMDQVAESDSEVAKLQAKLQLEESSYHTLERSHEILKEKEEELRQVRETHLSFVEKTEQDFHKPLTPVGSSREEKGDQPAKEEDLKTSAEGSSVLTVATNATGIGKVEDPAQYSPKQGRLPDLGCMLIEDSHEGPSSSQRQICGPPVVSTEECSSPSKSVDLPEIEMAQKDSTQLDAETPGAKRQRIRFSNIQCQKYIHPDGSEKMWASSTSSDTSQERSLSEESMTSEPAFCYPASGDSETYLSIIHSLETKLYITEEKLKDVTMKLESQQGQNQDALLVLHHQWSGVEAQLREQLQDSLTRIRGLVSQVEREKEEKVKLNEDHIHELGRLHEKTSRALMCLNQRREELKHVGTSDKGEEGEMFLDALSSIESTLMDAIQMLQKALPPAEHQPEEHLAVQALQTKDSLKGRRSPWTFLRISSSRLLTVRWLKPKLGFVAQKMRESFHQRLKAMEEDLHNARTALEIQEGTSEADRPTWHVSLQDRILEAQSIQDLSSQALAAVQDDLAQQLKDKANVLKEIAAALLSVSPDNALKDCQKLLKISRSPPYEMCMGDLERYSSLLVQDAIIQAQVCYGAYRARLECTKEAQVYKESLQNMDALCQEQYEVLLQKQQNEFAEMIAMLRRENEDLRAKVEQLDNQRRLLEEEERKQSQKIAELQSQYSEEMQKVVEQLHRTEDTLQVERIEGSHQLEALVQDKENLERYHLEQMQSLEEKFQVKMKEIQVLHDEELQILQERYNQNLKSLEESLEKYQKKPPDTTPGIISGAEAPGEDQHDNGIQDLGNDPSALHGLRERIQELESQMNVMRDELENKQLEGNTPTLREKYQKDFENLKATCERGFAAMEETHQKKIEDLQRQHHRELEKLREEKDRLLAEETANAHREELERELEKTHRSQISSINSDIEALQRQYLEELQSVQRELEVLSEQYSQKCLENAHLAQALEAERQALRQCQRENQELNAHNQELNNRLAAEITQLRTLLTGEGGMEMAASPLTQGKDAYELEVLLRVKESEIQYLKQEISSLKDELQTALRDKKYASDKYKDIYTELSIVKAKADCDISRLKEQLKTATEALGEKSPESSTVSGYDIMKSKSNPDFLKKDRTSIGRQLRNIRSKVS